MGDHYWKLWRLRVWLWDGHLRFMQPSLLHVASLRLVRAPWTNWGYLRHFRNVHLEAQAYCQLSYTWKNTLFQVSIVHLYLNLLSWRETNSKSKTTMRDITVLSMLFYVICYINWFHSFCFIHGSIKKWAKTEFQNVHSIISNTKFIKNKMATWLSPSVSSWNRSRTNVRRP